MASKGGGNLPPLEMRAWGAIVERLRSPHADKVFVARDCTKADLIRDLESIARSAESEGL